MAPKRGNRKNFCDSETHRVKQNLNNIIRFSKHLLTPQKAMITILIVLHDAQDPKVMISFTSQQFKHLSERDVSKIQDGHHN